MSSRPRRLRSARRNRRLTFSPYGPAPVRPPYMDEDVGGGRVYGEYNKGPVKVGGEWTFDEDANERVGGGRVYGEYNKGPVKVGGEWTFDEDANERVGGGRVYGEYNKGPVKVGGEWTFDEDANEQVGWRGAAINYGPQVINAVRTWGPAVKHCVGSLCGFDESEDVGGGRVYGEYNKGPVKVGGEWTFDEDERVGFGGYGGYNVLRNKFNPHQAQWRL